MFLNTLEVVIISWCFCVMNDETEVKDFYGSRQRLARRDMQYIPYYKSWLSSDPGF